MESRYIRLNYEEALTAKKSLLSSEINILNISKNIESFKRLRKKELLAKTQLKSAITELKNKLNVFESTFPEEFGKVKIQTRKFEKKENPKSRHIQDELEDIKIKLAKLQ